MKHVRKFAALFACIACLYVAGAQSTPGIIAGSNASAVAVDPLLHRVFVTHRGTGTMSLIDSSTLASVGEVPAGTQPGAVIADSATSRAYVLNDGSPGTLLTIDSASGDIIGSVAVGSHPTGLGADFTRHAVYAANNGESSIAVVDTVDGSVTKVTVGRGPNGIGVDRARGRIYVANTLDGTLSVVDSITREVVATVDVGANPGLPAIDGRTGRVLVPLLDAGAVAVVDGSTLGVTAVVPVGAAPTNGALSAAYRKFFVANAGDGSLSVIDLDTLDAGIVGSVAVTPVSVSVDEDGGTVYVVNRRDTSVTVIDPLEARVKDVYDTLAVRPKAGSAAASANLFVRLQDDGSLATPALMMAPRLVEDTAIAVEYFDADAGLFFHTADATEKRLVDDGIYGQEWQRSESYFRVWTSPAEGRVAMCRFFDFADHPATPHLYVYGDDCASARASGTWSFQTIAYYVAEPTNGTCPEGTDALFRMYQPGKSGGPSYRYTTEPAARAELIARGGIVKARDIGSLFACTPAMGKVALAVTGPPPAKSPPVRRGPIPLLPRPF